MGASKILGLSQDEMVQAINLAIAPNISLGQTRVGEVSMWKGAAMANAARELPEITLCDDPYQTAEGVDALILATEWNEFKQLDFKRIYKLMRSPVLVDGRNQWDSEHLRAIGFTYFGIGQGNHVNGNTTPS